MDHANRPDGEITRSPAMLRVAEHRVRTLGQEVGAAPAAAGGRRPAVEKRTRVEAALTAMDEALTQTGIATRIPAGRRLGTSARPARLANGGTAAGSR
ncbi:hypothetical protein KPL78_26875 [Roseomonas sp. HJA6]|uniref:Uncharacterized protein n=1 Tax=Roseomonas alba TaxID=2846776 RepID=A0ABS7AGS0_9PROT|nr:hypothetical protein [Neoroseomonas alba]MBW6401504.1 hypothetical protein [Neoroseomonas alba]